MRRFIITHGSTYKRPGVSEEQEYLSCHLRIWKVLVGKLWRIQKWDCLLCWRILSVILHMCLSNHLCSQVRPVKDKAWCGYADWNPLRLCVMWRAGPEEVAVWCLVLGCGHCKQTGIWRNPWVSQNKVLSLLCTNYGNRLAVCKIQRHGLKR